MEICPKAEAAGEIKTRRGINHNHIVGILGKNLRKLRFAARSPLALYKNQRLTKLL
jgi:hypothetical protein